MKSTNLFVLFLILVSCSYRVKTSDSSYFIFNEVQEAAQVEMYRGNEKRSELRETFADKSELERSKSAIRLLGAVSEIDSIVFFQMKNINKLKREVFVSPAYLKEYKEKEIWPKFLETANMELRMPFNTEGKIISINKNIKSFRTDLSSIIVRNPENGYFFKDPQITYYKDKESLLSRLETSVLNSKVSGDDQQALIKIYIQLTKVLIEQSVYFESPLDYLSYLTGIQRVVLAARADAISLIRCRISGQDFPFDKIVNFIDAPQNAMVGDTIDLSFFMAAFNSFKQPEVILNGESLQDVKGGIARKKMVVPNVNELNLTGTITYRNKSGIPKTLPFDKKIKVFRKDK